VETTYEPDKPVVTKVVMRHITEELDITDVLLYGTSPVFRYDPGQPLAFDVTVTNPEEAGRLFITSTKGSQMKYIEAFYNAETGGCFNGLSQEDKCGHNCSDGDDCQRCSSCECRCGIRQT
jgi:hypothetical protein